MAPDRRPAAVSTLTHISTLQFWPPLPLRMPDPPDRRFHPRRYLLQALSTLQPILQTQSI